MRRKDREITSQEEQMKIWRACKVCRLAMVDGNRPYVVPVNFGAAVEDGKIVLYIHGAKEGRKLDILREAPAVCVEADLEYGLTPGKTACGYGYAFASVIGEGKAEILEDPSEKAHGLSVLMEQQTGKAFFFTKEQAEAVAVLRISLESCTGKQKKP